MSLFDKIRSISNFHRNVDAYIRTTEETHGRGQQALAEELAKPGTPLDSFARSGGFEQYRKLLDTRPAKTDADPSIIPIEQLPDAPGPKKTSAPNHVTIAETEISNKGSYEGQEPVATIDVNSLPNAE